MGRVLLFSSHKGYLNEVIPFNQSNTFSTARVQQDSWHAFAHKQPDLLKL